MNKIWRISLIICCLFAIQCKTLAKIGSTELIENAKKYDRRIVVFEGEVIREAMFRGRYGWVNVSDGSNAIGIWTLKKNLLKIKKYGCYQNSGDIVRVIGVFQQSCPEHGGDLDIHAQSLEILKSGHKNVHKIETDKIYWVFLSLALALIIISRVNRNG